MLTMSMFATEKDYWKARAEKAEQENKQLKQQVSELKQFAENNVHAAILVEPKVIANSNGFECPDCGSRAWGTSNATSPYDKWIGHCHGCNFTWHRKTDDEKILGYKADEFIPAIVDSQPDQKIKEELKKLLSLLETLASNAYVNYIGFCRVDACLGWEYKTEKGIFGEGELKAHKNAAEQLGRHRALSEIANVVNGIMQS